jgi:hypothetical protein
MDWEGRAGGYWCPSFPGDRLAPGWNASAYSIEWAKCSLAGALPDLHLCILACGIDAGQVFRRAAINLLVMEIIKEQYLGFVAN